MVIEDKRDRYARLYFEGKLVVVTRRSLGTRALDGNIPHLIRQQMRLNEEQFENLIKCPLGRNEYIAILRDKKLL